MPLRLGLETIREMSEEKSENENGYKTPKNMMTGGMINSQVQNPPSKLSQEESGADFQWAKAPSRDVSFFGMRASTKKEAEQDQWALCDPQSPGSSQLYQNSCARKEKCVPLCETGVQPSSGCSENTANDYAMVNNHEPSSSSTSASTKRRLSRRKRLKMSRKAIGFATVLKDGDVDSFPKLNRPPFINRNDHNDDMTLENGLDIGRSKQQHKTTKPPRTHVNLEIDGLKVNAQLEKTFDLIDESSAAGNGKALPDRLHQEAEISNQSSHSNTTDPNAQTSKEVIDKPEEIIITAKQPPTKHQPSGRLNSAESPVPVTGVIRNGFAQKIGKRHKSISGPPTSSSQIPTVSKALGILQWTWDQEKQALEAHMEAEIESHRQNAINSERKAAEDARESITFQKVNEELLLKLNDKSTKLESLSKDFNKISLFTRGLGTDLSRGNGKLLRVNEEIKSLVDERELLKSQYCLFESQITQSRLEIQELRSKYRELLTEAESTKRGLESEIVCFQAKLEEKELLLAREIEINTSAHRAEYWNQRLQNHVEELLNATKEHLTSKLGEFVAQQEPPSPSREEMSVLKVLLEEIHSRHYVTLHDLKALEATLGGLWMKFGSTLDEIRSQQDREENRFSVENFQAALLKNIEDCIKTLCGELGTHQDLHQQLFNVNIENAILKEQITQKDERLSMLENDVETLRIQKTSADTAVINHDLEANNRISILNSTVKELQGSLVAAEKSLQISQHSDSTKRNEMQLLTRKLQEIEAIQQAVMEESVALPSKTAVALSKLHGELVTEAQHELKQRSSELQNRLQQVELKYQQAEQSLQEMKNERRDSLKAVEIQHSTAINELKRQHLQVIEQLKMEHRDQIANAQRVAEVEKRTSIDHQRQLSEETHLKEKALFEQKLEEESAKSKALEQTMNKLNEEHAQQIRLCEQLTAEELSSLRRSTLPIHNEFYESLNSKFSQLQLENHLLRSKLALLPESQKEHQGRRESARTIDSASQMAQEAIPLKIQNDPLVNSTHENYKEYQESSNGDFEKSLSVSSKLLRLKDIASMLEPATSFELNSGINTMLDSVMSVAYPGTPLCSNRHASEEIEKDFPQVLSSESGVNHMGLLTDPFLPKDTLQTQQTESLIKQIPPTRSQNTDAIPFNLLNISHELLRSSVPPSTCGSLGSASVLASKSVASRASKSKQKSQGVILDPQHMHEFEASATCIDSGPHEKPSQLSRDNPQIYIGNVNGRDRKRTIPLDSQQENVAKRRMALPNSGKIRRVPLNDSGQGMSMPQQLYSGEDRFKVVGSPHIGQFPHNRPPTAKMSSTKPPSSRGSQRRFLKRSEIMMVARFDQELGH